MRKNYNEFRSLLLQSGTFRDQKEQAEYLGMSESKLSTYYNGVMPGTLNLLRLTEKTGLPFNKLISPKTLKRYFASGGYDGMPPEGATMLWE